MNPETDDLDLDIPPLDRGRSPIAGRVGSPAFRGWTLLLGAGAGLTVLILAAVRPPGAPEAPPEATAATEQVVRFEPAAAAPAPPAGAWDLELEPEPEEIEATSEAPAVPDETGETPTTVPGPSPLMVHSAAPATGDHPAGADAAASSLGVETAASPVARAQAFPIDRRFTVLAGAHLPCLLEGALDSSTPGLVTCILPRDVRSDDGALVVMEKGTRVLGEYRSGLARGGQRLHILWTRAVTPNGVAVALASPAGDALGRAGLAGDLDRRFWERFGGAVLMSIVEGAASSLADRADRPLIAAPSAAGQALEQSSDLPPRLTLAQGAEVTLQVAQDLDFAGVYDLQLRGARERR